MPCVPRSQSKACEQGVKFVRSVTETWSEETSEGEIGLKRVSSKALEQTKGLARCITARSKDV